MDETDTTRSKSPEELSAEAARQWADQRRAQARAQFETPSWIGPARGDAAHAIPQQTEPEHDDDVDEALPPVVSESPIPNAAHWSKRNKPRAVVGTVLVLALTGVVTFLVLTIINQSAVAIAGLAASAFVAVIFRGALMGSGINTVELHGSMLRIRRGGAFDQVNLADPVHPVELVGSPDQPTWRLHLEAVDGRPIVIDPTQVDAPELDRIVRYYRAIANRALIERQRRFSR